MKCILGAEGHTNKPCIFADRPCEQLHPLQISQYYPLVIIKLLIINVVWFYQILADQDKIIIILFGNLN